MSSARSRSLIVTPLRTSSARHAILAERVSPSTSARASQGELMVFAHGIGGAKDLPIPAEYAIAGAGAALAVSFIVLALAWRTPRFDAAHNGRPVPSWLARIVDSPLFAAVWRAVGFAFFLYVVWAALAGPDLVITPVFGVVFV